MTLVKAATWMTHLEHDLDSPVGWHWTSFLSGHFCFLRYDERGCGMSDWDSRDLSMERRVLDLETVVEAAGVADPFVLLGISHGAAVCIAYAVRHPERADLASLWGSDNPAPVFDALPRRERETLALLVGGLSNAEIAERLAISEKTVRNYVSNLFDKLGVWSRAQAIVFARDHGFGG